MPAMRRIHAATLALLLLVAGPAAVGHAQDLTPSALANALGIPVPS